MNEISSTKTAQSHNPWGVLGKFEQAYKKSVPDF